MRGNTTPDSSTERIFREHAAQVGEDVLALACGPPPMIQFGENGL